MPKAKYPPNLSEWLRSQGVKLKLAELLQVDDKVLPVFLVTPLNYAPSVFPAGGKLLDNYVVNLTASGAGFNTNNKEHRFIVPTGKRWLFFAGVAKPDTSAVMDAMMYNQDDELILVLIKQIGAGTSVCPYPNTIADAQCVQKGIGIPMKAGWYVRIVFGADQGTSAYASCIVLEVDE